MVGWISLLAPNSMVECHTVNVEVLGSNPRGSVRRVRVILVVLGVKVPYSPLMVMRGNRCEPYKLAGVVELA